MSPILGYKTLTSVFVFNSLWNFNNNVISAEPPDPNIDPDLFRIVTKSMIHGSCSRLNSNPPCMDENHQCTKRFPRAFINETQTGLDGYPLYRRRKPEDGGQATTIDCRHNSSVPIDNRWIVPYSPILCRMFNAHTGWPKKDAPGLLCL